MYSLILMTAVASTGDSSSFNWRRGGCNGCYGSAAVVVAAPRPAPITYSVGCYGTPGYVVGGWASFSGCCGGCWSSWGPSFYSYPVYGGCTRTVAPVMDCCGYTTLTTSSPTSSVSEGFANIKLELPADAKLVVDGQPVPGSGSLRTFSTPKLPAGKSFVYEMTAETIVGGTTVREDLKVVVHAGDKLEKTFPKLLAAMRSESPTAVVQK